MKQVVVVAAIETVVAVLEVGVVDGGNVIDGFVLVDGQGERDPSAAGLVADRVAVFLAQASFLLLWQRR